MNLTENELIDIVREKMDPDDIIDILGITSSDLAEAFSLRLVDKSSLIQEFLDMDKFMQENEELLDEEPLEEILMGYEDDEEEDEDDEEDGIGDVGWNHE